MVIERPILYSTPMVLAKLAGRKTQTRRIIKESFNGCLTGGPHPCPNEPVVMQPGEKYESPVNQGEFITIDYPEVRTLFFCSTMDKEVKCPYGKVGDILWGREAYSPHIGAHGESIWYAYRASHEHGYGPWKPSIHMPKSAARIWERVTEIRVERLQDITEEDAIAEGIEKVADGWKSYEIIYTGRHKGESHPHAVVPNKSARLSYEELWNSINGEGSWDLNPWVWVITTETLSTTGRPENL